MAINKAEHETCTLQIAREWIHSKDNDFNYGPLNDNQLIAFSQRMMLEKAMPIISVDLTRHTMDKKLTNAFISYDVYLFFRCESRNLEPDCLLINHFCPCYPLLLGTTWLRNISVG